MLKLFYNNKYNLLIILAYILICFSISSKSFDIINIFTSKLNFATFVNFLRSFINFILLLIFIVFFFFNLSKNKKNHPDIILKLFFIFILVQIIGAIYNPKIYENFYEYNVIFNNFSNKIFIFLFILFDQSYFLISQSAILLFFFIINIFFKKFKIEYLLIISLIIFFSYFFFFAFNIYKEFLVSSSFNAYGTSVSYPDKVFFNHSVPRITGASRFFLFLYIIASCYTFFILKKRNYAAIATLYLIIILLGSLIWAFQVRAVLLIKLIVDFLLIFFLEKKIKNKIAIFLILTFFPVILHNSIIIIKNEKSRNLFFSEISSLKFKLFTQNNINKNNYDNIDIRENLNLDNTNPLNLIISTNRVFNMDTSGRTQIWNEIIKKSKESLFFGYGSQADRWYINRSDSFYNNASSALFYSLICAGIFGILIYILIVYQTLVLLYLFVKKRVFFRNSNLLVVSSFYILVSLLIRSLFENSFMIFSIDNIFFLTCYFIINKRVKQIL